MVKNIGGGSTGGSGGSTTNNYSTLTAATFVNTSTMTSPSGNITSLTAPTLNSTTATATNLNAGVLTNTTSLTSPSATITSLTAPTLSTTNLTSTAITNSGAISTASLTATGTGITTTDCTISGTLSMNGALSLTNIQSTTITVGSEVTTFPINVSEFDATAVVPDNTNGIGSSINDTRVSLSAIQVGTDLSISIDDNGAVAAGLLNGINGGAAIDFPFSQTSYLDADANSFASSNAMTICAAFKMSDTENAMTIVSYTNAQPSINIAVGGNLWIERTGKYNLDTGITLAVGTNYILVVTLSVTGGINVRVNGVLQYTNTTSYGSYFFNTDLALIGRHMIIDTQFFIGRLGDLMTAARLLTDTEITNVEGYLSAKFQIGIGSSATISAGDPFSTGSGSVVIYGALDTTDVTTDTLAVSSTATLFASGATISAGTLTVSDTITTQNLTASIITTSGMYYENTLAAIQTATANIYNLPYTNAGIYYISGVDYPTTNFSVLIQSIPTDTTKIYTLSLVYYQSSAAFYCNAVAVTDSDASYILGTATTYETPKFSGGTPTFTSSPNLVIQQFSIISIPDTVGVMTRHVVSSVSPFS